MVTKDTTHSLCIILGMHKSGTSFLVSSLFNSGFSVGHDVSEIGYQKKSKGESPELRDINNEILGTAGLHSTSIIRKRGLPKLNDFNPSIFIEAGEYSSGIEEIQGWSSPIKTIGSQSYRSIKSSSLSEILFM